MNLSATLDQFEDICLDVLSMQLSLARRKMPVKRLEASKILNIRDFTPIFCTSKENQLLTEGKVWKAYRKRLIERHLH